MPTQRNIVRRGFTYNGQRYREGQDFKAKSEKELMDLVKRGKVVVKQFADEGEPLHEVTERQPEVRNQENKLASSTTKKAASDSKPTAGSNAAKS